MFQRLAVIDTDDEHAAEERKVTNNVDAKVSNSFVRNLIYILLKTVEGIF